MRTTGKSVISVLVLAAIGSIGLSCSHDTLDSGTEALAVDYVPSPSGSGRYDRASLDISTIRVLPEDPETAAIYGSNPLSLRFAPFTADLTLTQPVAFSEVGLAAGTYKITLIGFTSPFLVDSDENPNPATCIEGVAAIPSGPAAGDVPALTTFTDTASLTFTVRPGQSKLSLSIDVPGLIAGYEGAFTCNPDCGGGQPCLTSFDQDAYASALLANISFE